MRSSIDAQSCASVPPEPDWMSRKQLFGSIGCENMRRNSIAATRFSMSCMSAAVLAGCHRRFPPSPFQTARRHRKGFAGYVSGRARRLPAFCARAPAPGRVWHPARWRGLRRVAKLRLSVPAWYRSQRYLRNSALRVAKSCSWLERALSCSASMMLSLIFEGRDYTALSRSKRAATTRCISWRCRALSQSGISSRSFLFCAARLPAGPRPACRRGAPDTVEYRPAPRPPAV